MVGLGAHVSELKVLVKLRFSDGDLCLGSVVDEDGAFHLVALQGDEEVGAAALDVVIHPAGGDHFGQVKRVRHVVGLFTACVLFRRADEVLLRKVEERGNVDLHRRRAFQDTHIDVGDAIVQVDGKESLVVRKIDDLHQSFRRRKHFLGVQSLARKNALDVDRAERHVAGDLVTDADRTVCEGKIKFVLTAENGGDGLAKGEDGLLRSNVELARDREVYVASEVHPRVLAERTDDLLRRYLQQVLVEVDLDVIRRDAEVRLVGAEIHFGVDGYIRECVELEAYKDGAYAVQSADIHVLAKRDQKRGDQGGFRLDLHARLFRNGHAGEVREDAVDAIRQRGIFLKQFACLLRSMATTVRAVFTRTIATAAHQADGIGAAAGKRRGGSLTEVAASVASVGAVGSAAAVRHAIGIGATAGKRAFRSGNGAASASATIRALGAIANARLRARSAITSANILRAGAAAAFAVADPDAVLIVTTAVVDAQNVLALVVLTATAIQSGLGLRHEEILNGDVFKVSALHAQYGDVDIQFGDVLLSVEEEERQELVAQGKSLGDRQHQLGLFEIVEVQGGLHGKVDDGIVGPTAGVDDDLHQCVDAREQTVEHRTKFHVGILRMDLQVQFGLDRDLLQLIKGLVSGKVRLDGIAGLRIDLLGVVDDEGGLAALKFDTAEGEAHGGELAGVSAVFELLDHDIGRKRQVGKEALRLAGVHLVFHRTEADVSAVVEGDRPSIIGERIQIAVGVGEGNDAFADGHILRDLIARQSDALVIAVLLVLTDQHDLCHVCLVDGGNFKGLVFGDVIQREVHADARDVNVADGVARKQIEDGGKEAVCRAERDARRSELHLRKRFGDLIAAVGAALAVAVLAIGGTDARPDVLGIGAEARQHVVVALAGLGIQRRACQFVIKGVDVRRGGDLDRPTIAVKGKDIVVGIVDGDDAVHDGHIGAPLRLGV